MIIVDTALEKLASEGKSIRVGMVGAGFMASGTVLETFKYRKGINIVGISNRNLKKAKKAYEQAGIKDVIEVSSQTELDENIKNGKYSITKDPTLLCNSENIDVILEMTGNVEFGAQVAL